MYADGGPGPRLPEGVFGPITITNRTTRVVYTAHQDGDGYFRVTLPVGSYVVSAIPRDGFRSAAPFTRAVTVKRDATAKLDFGIHMF